ncbi:MAG: hypothetical protein M3N93_12710, partial [Acidobacteriota bacterium]|nr:hypothetical protein [Acidobacteriota bacterium]
MTTTSRMLETAPTPVQPASGQPRKSIYMVLGCTVFAAAAQVLMKFGMAHALPAFQPGNSATWLPFAIALVT